MGIRACDESLSSKTYEGALNFKLLVDSFSQEFASNILLKLLGNAMIQGSSDNSNWHYNLLSTDKYFRISTDGGVTFVYSDLNLFNKYYFNNGIPYTDENQVKTLIPIANRYQYQTVNIAGVEYWFSDSGLDTLTTKQSSSIADASITVAKLQNVASKSLLFRSLAGTGPLSVVSLASFMAEMNLSGSNSGDETVTTIKSKLGITTLSGDNTGDQNASQVSITDLADYFIANNVEDALAEVKLLADTNKLNIEKSISNKRITLPAYSSVSLRCSNAIESTDYPTGWILSTGSSEYDLKITHNLNKNLVGITIFEVNGDLTERFLPPFSAAYTGILQNSKNEIVIEGLTQDNSPLRINLVFEQ